MYRSLNKYLREPSLSRSYDFRMKKLGRPREFDMEQALDQAMRVFWQKGYLGTTIADLTAAMGIKAPSLYKAFGSKEGLFFRVLEVYNNGPVSYLRDALEEPTARRVVEARWRGAAKVGTASANPSGCLWLHNALSSGDEPVRAVLESQRPQGDAALRDRFTRSVAEGDLPAGTDCAALAQFVTTVNLGIAVQAHLGAPLMELEAVIEIALRSIP